MEKTILSYLILITFQSVCGQKVEPDYIKSVQLKPLKQDNFSIVVPFGSTLELSFDDLEADQKDYYYKIEQMNHDWTPSNLLSSQYITGFQSQIIFDVENSFNTLQNYTHYSVRFPNQNTRITKSGNYRVSILDEDEEVIFTRRFTYYESIAPVGVQVTRSRDARFLNEKQTVNFTVNHPTIKLNMPNQEIHIAILQNQNWKNAITEVQPQFFKSGQLVYRYIKKTNFWSGNEYLFFDTKIIRTASVNSARIERKEVYHNYLYPYQNQRVKNYTYNPDINGQFLIRTIESQDSKTESDYAIIHFRVNVEEELYNKTVYVYGAFNNFTFNFENQMVFDPDSRSYNTNLLLKQGFYNYTYVTQDISGTVSQADIRGNFFKTENEYTVVVYYKPLGGLYDRVIGVGNITFEGER